MVICRRCGREIVAITSTLYSHVPAHGILYVRGCRAASFNPANENSAWDNTLPKTWVATP
jgi:hypothetical protein